LFVASAPIVGTTYETILGGWNEAMGIFDRDIAAMEVQI
jgi:hypothetical protein